MKIRLDLADGLLRAIRRSAADEGVSLDQFVERSLRETLAPPNAGFRLRLVTFRGDGLHPDAADAGWGRLRDTLYIP